MNFTKKKRYNTGNIYWRLHKWILHKKKQYALKVWLSIKRISEKFSLSGTVVIQRKDTWNNDWLFVDLNAAGT